MEILYVKSDKIMFSLSGDACGREKIKIYCIDEYTSQSRSGCLYKGKNYRTVLLNLSEEKVGIAVNGKEKEGCSLCGEEGVLSIDLTFDKAGPNNIKIFLSDIEYINMDFEVCIENENYKIHFHDMKSSISRIAKHEILTYLKEKCEKEDIGISKDAKNACDMLLPATEKIIFLLHNENNRKYYSGDLFSAKKRIKKNIKRFKSINIYNTGENRRLKSEAVRLADFLGSVVNFCGDESEGIKELKEHLQNELNKSVVLMADTECGKNKINIEGSFYSVDLGEIDSLYKFFCFAGLNEILTKHYMPLDNKIFPSGPDIYESRQTKYINTENDNVITLTYSTSEEKPVIFMKINKKDKITSHRRVYIFEPVYKENADVYESDTAYKYKGMYESGLVSDVHILCFSNPGEYKNVISLSPYSCDKAENFLVSVLGDCDLKEFVPYEDAVCDVCKEDFYLRDVLVAVVKTKSQFNINIKEKFYYIPSKFIEDYGNVRYVALYQSKALFGAEAGIRYFGEVIKTSLVPRYKIAEVSKNSDELYLRFDVKSWQTLDNVIKPKDFAEVCMFTNMFLLRSVKELPELYINSLLEYIFYSAEDIVNFRFENAYFKCTKEDVTVYLKTGQTVKFGRSAYKAAALKIEEMLKGESK